MSKGLVNHWGISPKSSTDPRFTYVDVPTPLAAKFLTQLAEEAPAPGDGIAGPGGQASETVCRDSLCGAVLD